MFIVFFVAVLVAGGFSIYAWRKKKAAEAEPDPEMRAARIADAVALQKRVQNITRILGVVVIIALVLQMMARM